LKGPDAKHNIMLPSFVGELPIHIGSFSKLPSTWNLYGIKKGSIGTQGAPRNELQGVAPISNVCMLDIGVDNEHNMA
jgi:hypothetical protein